MRNKEIYKLFPDRNSFKVKNKTIKRSFVEASKKYQRKYSFKRNSEK